LIVEDQAMMAELLQANLEGHADIAVVGVAGTVEEAVRLARSLEPAVIVMDYDLPDGSGAQAAAALRAVGRASAVVMLSVAAERYAVETAVLAGAVGYLAKSEPVRRVADAIRRAAAGEMLLPAVLLREVALKAQRHWRDGVSPLTAREQKTIDLACAGLDIGSIAGRLGVTVREARFEYLSVMEKFSDSLQMRGAHAGKSSHKRKRDD
jgi:DNA-binding NarL/FixJ family response regulator